MTHSYAGPYAYITGVSGESPEKTLRPTSKMYKLQGRLKAGCSQDWLPHHCLRAHAEMYKIQGRLKAGCSQDWLPHQLLLV